LAERKRKQSGIGHDDTGYMKGEESEFLNEFIGWRRRPRPDMKYE
jgi:hypothetical protein